MLNQPDFSGLFGMINQLPTANPDDPASMKKLAQVHMMRGNTQDAAVLMKQAEQKTAEQAEGAAQNIKRTYDALYAENPARAEEFKATMVKAGKGDVITQLEKEKKQTELFNIEYDNAVEQEEFEGFMAEYQKAQSPEGKEVVLSAAREAGHGVNVQKYLDGQETQRLKKRTDEINLEIKQLQVAEEKVKTLPVPPTLAGAENFLKSLPPQLQAPYEARMQETFVARKEFADAVAPREMYTKDYFDGQNTKGTWEGYLQDVGALGVEAANTKAANSVYVPKVTAKTTPKVPNEKYIENYKGKIQALIDQNPGKGVMYDDADVNEMEKMVGAYAAEYATAMINGDAAKVQEIEEELTGKKQTAPPPPAASPATKMSDEDIMERLKELKEMQRELNEPS